MASSVYAVKVIEQCRISPPRGSVPDTSLPLTFFDIVWLNTDPVERIFFYEFLHPTTHFIENLLPNLKSSLSLTLQQFYPLAGHLRRFPGSADKFEICYKDGDSISLALAESDDDFQRLSGSHARHVPRLHPLLPRLPDSDVGKPLLALQVTVFANHGISVGITIHHAACDGSSSMHFMKSWATACSSGSTSPIISPPPLHDRTVITDPGDLRSIFLEDMRKFSTSRPKDSPCVAAHDSKVLATFSLGREHIERLKGLVLAGVGDGEAPFHCSTFVAACAYAWLCLIRSQEGDSGEKFEHFVFAVECRSRLRPPIQQSYFGNCLGPGFAKANASELGAADGLLVAAKAIGRAIEGLGDGILKGAEGWLKKFLSFPQHALLSVAGSPKFRVYDTDFGWGRPKKVDIISIRNTGAISLAESREEQGGIEIGLALAKPAMDKFETEFSKNLKPLWDA